MGTKQRLHCPFCSHVVEAHPGRAKWALAVHTWSCSVATPEERTAWYLTRRWPKRVTIAAKGAQARRSRVLDRYDYEIDAATARGFIDTAERIAVERDDLMARGE